MTAADPVEWTDWVLAAALVYRAIVVMVPGANGKPQALLMPIRGRVQ